MGLNCSGIIELKDIKDIPKELIRQMKEIFPDSPYSIIINLWDDYTYRVQCRHGEPVKNGMCTIHIWQYYKGEFSYEIEIEKAKTGV